MINGIIGRKLGMTQLFAEDGTVTPVTVIKAGPCVVVQTKTTGGKDGYNAVQLGFVEDKPIRLKNVSKPMLGHFEKTGGGTPPTRILKEFRLKDAPDVNVGDQVKADLFADGDTIEVVAANAEQFAYAVEWSELYPAASAPVEEILRQSDAEEITLISCGGAFDGATGLYVDRLIVRAQRIR